MFITAKIASIFISLSAVHKYDFHIFTVKIAIVYNQSNSLILIAWHVYRAKFYNLHINNVLGSWPYSSF